MEFELVFRGINCRMLSILPLWRVLLLDGLLLVMVALKTQWEGMALEMNMVMFALLKQLSSAGQCKPLPHPLSLSPEQAQRT